ncbi:hypothetical protein HJFPF1_10395 [Paramyrothecium foliicola]|nr:hypothetical protein HJFPF1_10395 [Paramyrothecium foliicola]
MEQEIPAQDVQASSSQSSLKPPKARNGKVPARYKAQHEDYTIAWICALSLELAASRAILDEEHLPLHVVGDDNTYVLGRIHQHNVVMACLPGQYGTNNAAIVATNLKRSFPNIRATLMVGIGGGAPGRVDLRLGDIVVGTSVIQYDMGKVIMDGQFHGTADAKSPARLLGSAVSILQSRYRNHGSGGEFTSFLQTNIIRPNHIDRLFDASYEHPHGASTCEGCDQGRLMPRPVRSSDQPAIHYGGIASGNSVMKNAKRRDEIAQQRSVICFEMEAAGMMDNVQCLPIRGICDYADSHKNKEWQDYAAATAAAYAKELLGVLSYEPRRTTWTSKQLIKSPVEAANWLWVKIPPRRQRIVIALALLVLVSTVVIGPCIKFIPNKIEVGTYIRSKQDELLPQVLSTAELDGQLYLLARGRDGSLSVTSREQGSFTLKWNSIAQRTQSQPTSVVWGNPKRLSVFYAGDDKVVMTGMLYNGAWGELRRLGAKVSSPVILCHERVPDVPHAWAREDAEPRRIVHNHWEPDANDYFFIGSDWEMGVNHEDPRAARSAPAVVCRNSTEANDVFIYDQQLRCPLHRQWLGILNRWGPWHALNGTYVGDPIVISPTDDRVEFFGVSQTGRSLINISWTAISGYTSNDLKGSWKSVPSVIATSRRLDVFILSESGMVNHRARIGSTWNSNWSNLNISAVSAPLATLLDTTPPRIILIVIGAGDVVLSSEWEVTDDGGLVNLVPLTQIGEGISAEGMAMN